MEAIRAVAANLTSTALAAIVVLRTSLRALIGWTFNIASRQAEVVAILGQSVTLFLLSLAIAYFRKPKARHRPSRLLGKAKGDL